MRAIFAAFAASLALTAGEASAAVIREDLGHDWSTDWGFQWQVWAEGEGLGTVRQARQATEHVDQEVVASLPPPIGLMAYSRARGSLEAGYIGAESISNLGLNHSRGQTDITMLDMLHFDLSELASDIFIDLPISISLAGHLGGAVLNRANFGFVLSTMEESLYVNRYWEGAGSINDAPITSTTTSGNWTQLDPDRYEGTLSLRGGRVNDVSFLMQLGTFGTADLGNSAYFTMDTDIPYTSASGVFLANPHTGIPPLAPVPLPGAAGMLLLASGFLGAVGLRRSTKQATNA